MNIDRVREFAEVYTSEKDVNNMLDTVNEETLRIDSRFLEPACGNGNFLVQILIRKINVIIKRYQNSNLEFERYIVQATSSIYGIDILQDNVEKCRSRLHDLIVKTYEKIFKTDISKKLNETIKYILSLNIVWGDALSLLDQKTKKPIIFSEWSFVSGSLIKRTDYIFKDLIAYQPFEKDTFFIVIVDEPNSESILHNSIIILQKLHYYF